MKPSFPLGQLMAAGFYGTTVPPDFVHLVRTYGVGNVILFRRNISDYDQLSALCRDLNRLILEETGHMPIIMSGEEGGTVSRIGSISAPTPCPMAVGATGDPENAFAIGRIIGEELRACGIHMALAPVLDCNCNPDNPVIGNRSFGADSQLVAAFGTAWIRGLQGTGTLACAKHFPGHGDTSTDSHLALPLIGKPLEAIQKTELYPFAAAIREGVKAIMSAHIVVPALDPGRVPAMVSYQIMTRLLRQEMGFQGLILSDGLEMKAVADLYGIEEAARMSLAAGCDMVLVCHDILSAASTMRHLLTAAEQGTLSEEDIRDRLGRVILAKKQLQCTPGSVREFGNSRQRAEARRVMARSLHVQHVPGGNPVPAIGPDTLFLSLPARPASIASDAAQMDAAAYFASALHAQAISSPLPESLPACDACVVFLSPHPELSRLRELACQACRRQIPVIAVSLGLPELFSGIPDSSWKITAWQYDELALSCLMDLLCKA